MPTAVLSPPEQGQLVTVRQRRFVVTEVIKSASVEHPLRPRGLGDQHLVALSSVEDDALGEELQVVWELEPGARVEERIALPEPTGMDDPERLDAFLDAVRSGAASTADVKSVQSPFRSGIEIEDYQLDPVVRAIQMPRVNLLIADDVGLGKTIEAGMTILELIIRHRARRVLIACPAALQVQWQEQMRDKFGLDFRIVDSNLMRDLRRKRGLHVNPWAHFPRLITSIDFLKRERPLRLFRETLPSEGESVYPRRYDILVVDEAHNCAPSGRGKYATDSMRTQALRDLVPHFEHKLFLTATPHNGYIESFSALLELLDDQRFARGADPDRKQLDVVMVRRLKSELPRKFDGSPRFPARKLEALEVAYTPEERAVHGMLKQYSKLRQTDTADHTEKFATDFVLMTLKKRLFSSPAAFQADPEISPVRILLATDAASEGIDLQKYCSRLIHYEIPWNPNRMEQRNGRVDRHGQKADKVLIHHFVGKGFERESSRDTPVGELEGDLEFLMRAAIKVDAIREDLGKVGPVIAEQVEDAMLGRRTRLDTVQAEKDSDTVRKMLKFERDLQKQIQRLREQLDETQRELRLSPENIQKVVEVALQVAGQPALIPTEAPGLWPNPKRPKCPAFRLPAFRWPWSACAEGLMDKFGGQVRPIVFDHSLAEGRDDVVLCHLNHRLVQMCLRLLRAEVWSTEGKKRLHRITARLVPDNVLREPAMIAHARLVVIGGDSQRLHEEVITAGGLLREGRFSRMKVGEVSDSLAAAGLEEPYESMTEKLLKLYSQHEQSLRTSLDARMKDRTSGLEKTLAEREQKEVSDITAILTELRTTIKTKLNDPELRQLTFEGWAEPERDQLERNLDALRRRVQEIPAEIERETEAIRKRFANPQPRMFPVAVTFLVPQRLAKD